MRVARTEDTPSIVGSLSHSDAQSTRRGTCGVAQTEKAVNVSGGIQDEGGGRLWSGLLPHGPALPKRCTADEQDHPVPALAQEDSLFTSVVSWLELTDRVRCVGAPVVHGENSDRQAPMGNEQSGHSLIGWRVRLYAAKLIPHRPHTGSCPGPRPANPVRAPHRATNHSRFPTTTSKMCRQLSLSGQPDSRGKSCCVSRKTLCNWAS